MYYDHFYVTLLDLPEVLPFGFLPSGKFAEDEEKHKSAENQMFLFVSALEKELGEEMFYIGEDVIEEKLYKRFLFNENGFIEVMIGVPAVISAHFSNKSKADRFAGALKVTIEKSVQNEKAKEILLNSIEMGGSSSEGIKFSTWDKLRGIRSEESP